MTPRCPPPTVAVPPEVRALELTPCARRLVAVEACVDRATVAGILAGRRAEPSVIARVVAALRSLEYLPPAPPVGPSGPAVAA